MLEQVLLTGPWVPGPRFRISVGLEITIKTNLIDALDVPNVMKPHPENIT